MKKSTTLIMTLAMAFGYVQAQVATEYFDGNAYNALLSANGTHFNSAKMFVPSAVGDTK